MILSLIAAISSANRAIGRENRLPWHLPEDLKRFRRLTSGHGVIMGRKTYDSIGRPLPNRENVIVTRAQDYEVPAGAVVARSIDEALGRYRSSEAEVFVIGGAEIYRQTLPFADRIYLTEIDVEVEGDAFFPALPAGQFRETSREEHRSPEGTVYRFVNYERIKR